MTSGPISIAIFGVTSDIAMAVARQYAEAGARLVIAGRNAAALSDAAADLRVRGAAEVAVVRADVRDPQVLSDIAEEAWSCFGGLDAALIAYGVMHAQADAERSAALASEVFAINFASPAILIGALANLFETKGQGTIAAITSVAGDRGRKDNYIYGSAKGGLQRFLQGLQHRMAGTKVRIVDIRPGFVRTRMTRNLQTDGPLWATPDRVARDIIRAIERGAPVRYTPGFWRLIMLIIRLMPRFVFNRLSLSAKVES